MPSEHEDDAGEPAEHRGDVVAGEPVDEDVADAVGDRRPMIARAPAKIASQPRSRLGRRFATGDQEHDDGERHEPADDVVAGPDARARGGR